MEMLLSITALFIAFLSLWFINHVTTSAEKSIYRMASKEITKLREDLKKQGRDLATAQDQIKDLKNSMGKPAPSPEAFTSPEAESVPDSEMKSAEDFIPGSQAKTA